MAFDGILLHQIVKQLQFLQTARISKIYQISDTEILFIIKSQKIQQLMISAHSSYNRIHLTERSYPTRSTPSNFIMLLRKYLEGGFITSIRQVSLDRYLIMEVSSRNELGDRIVLQLYIELMGKYANLILVNDGRIIDALKHIPPFENTIRTIQPGAQFKPTAPQKNKVDPFAISEPENRENLFEDLLGFSPLLSQEVLHRMNNGQSYQSIMQEIQQSDKLYICHKGKEEFFHCIALTHLSDKHETYPICQGLDHFYYAREERERIRNITGDLFKFTRREVSKYTQKIDRLNSQLQEAQSAERYRRYGEVLYANMDAVTKGLSSIELADYEGNIVTVPLDQKLDVKGNARKHFTKYHKLVTGQKYIAEQIEIAQNNLEYFNAISQQLEMADFRSAEEIRQELQNNGFLKAGTVRQQRQKKPTEPAYSHIRLSNAEVYVGHNNIQNDYLTFKKADRFDYWFHVKDATGGHVILTTDSPSEAQIRLCAMLAGYFSKLRDSSSIPVNYTMVKNLKKIPGSKLGKVIMKEYRTIYIDIDEKVLSEYIDL